MARSKTATADAVEQVKIRLQDIGILLGSLMEFNRADQKIISLVERLRNPKPRKPRAGKSAKGEA